MRVSCMGAKCVVTEVEAMASGAINYFSAEFIFDSDWNEFKTVNKLYGVFEGSNVIILTNIIYKEGKYQSEVPWETLRFQGELLVGVIGYIDSPEEKILTTNMAYAYTLPKGAATNASTGSQPSGLLLDVLEVAQNIEENIDRAEEAVKHFPYIDLITENWMRWDVENEEFVDTGVSATGPAAGFDTPTINVSQLAEGTQPTASIASSGPDTNKKFKFSFGLPKGDTGTAAEIIVGSTETGSPGTDAEVTNVGTEQFAILNFLIPQGLTGDDGISVVSIEKTNTNGLIDTYTITYSNGNTSSFNVKNGAKGDTGTAAEITIGNVVTGLPTDDAEVTNVGTAQSAIFDFVIPQGLTGVSVTSIVKTKTVGLIDTYTITYSDSTTSTFNVTNGAKGDTGTSIVSVEKTNTNGLIDTYTITFSNETTSLFYVKNGEKGDTGMGLTILGYYPTLADLQTAVSSPTPGMAYGVGNNSPYDIYIYDEVSLSWKQNGPITGSSTQIIRWD